MISTQHGSTGNLAGILAADFLSQSFDGNLAFLPEDFFSSLDQSADDTTETRETFTDTGNNGSWVDIREDAEAVPDTFMVSVFEAPVSNTTRQRLASWPELCRMLREDIVVLPDNKSQTKARNGQYFVRGVIAGNRDDENLSGCCLLILDIDKPLPGGELPTVHEIHDSLKDFFHVVCTSATPGRSRLVVPVEQYEKDQTATLTRQLYEHCRAIGIEFTYAGESSTASQPWFYGQTLDRNSHVCLVNDDGLLFNPYPSVIFEDDPKPDTDTTDEQQQTSNHLADFLAQLRTGTVHQAAKVYAGWMSRTTNLSKRQIFDDITVLVGTHCTDREKVQRWLDGERAELEAWFTVNVEEHEPEPEILTAHECQLENNFSLEIPETVKNPGGLISLGMKALSQPGMVDIDQYNLPVVLSSIANAIGGKLSFRGMWPNVFNVKIGPTSTGKSEGDKRIRNAINNTSIINFYGPTDFASGPALLRSMEARPRCLVVIDEGTSLFRRSGKVDMIADGKRDALLEIFSASGQRLEKAYADKRSSIVIENPCLSLTANATPAVFDSIESADFTTGLMQRFDFWTYDGPTPKRGRYNDDGDPSLDNFVAGIKAVFDTYPEGWNLQVASNAAFSLGITDDASDLLFEWSNTVVERQNVLEDGGLKGIVSRSYDLAIKYAMIHLAATRPPHALFLPISQADIQYGIDVAWMLADWKINRLRDRVTCGDFDRDSALFKEAIRRAVSSDKRPTLSVLVDRCHGLRNFSKNYLGQIIDTLCDRNEIVVDSERKKAAYRLVRK